jgi:hypothetical protein
MYRSGRIAVLAATGALAAGASGCALSPWDPETLPVLDQFQSRITAGSGTTAGYRDSGELIVEPGSTVQFRTRIGDGNAVIYSWPTTPAREVAVSVHAEDDPGDEREITLRGKGGAEVSVGNPTAFTPGYLGVEHHESTGEQSVRVVAPRLTGTPQGQAHFSFKLDVGGRAGVDATDEAAGG